MNTFLLNNDLHLKEAFGKLSNEDFNVYIKKICRLIHTDELNQQSVDNILKEYNIIQIEDIKEEILDLILSYINIVLDDNVMTETEAGNVKLLKRFFKVKEGDFYNYRYQKLEGVLSKQFERIYADNKINTDEALHKVGLQELFDLGYDQFLKLVNKEVKAALERGASLDELDTVFSDAYHKEDQSSQ